MACNGVTFPWGYNAVTQFAASGVASSEIKGAVRAWHFLADNATDKTRIWSVEKNDVLNVLFYEFVDKTGSPGAAWTPSIVRWDVKTYTVAGACKLLL